ncbi:Ras guanyl-nucleotide exchange factor RasGEF, putative [Metarhizium acridum CQMa 102]|uniref:Ras guanyl-nucleotide exchange factor RasGEF, putative n=2 Tax=Metarhizium acridum TaxID=92637 RepID=E9DYN3_METAQ|nr:Ras guanyl-nucleotide exchange factor RasGEF, putative [Metarhizium acridum CQMa 102]EFY91303.1 Ras guanyl-nucleotide exchange factor RasGEF, putative [Metarhizium acridum CQMa 102]
MPTTSSARLRSIYRSILRELPPRPVLASPRSHLHNLLRTSFTDSSATSHAEAEQLVAYLRSQRLYVTLIERYNPGMDMDEEERVRLTARRVGMDMPELYGRGKKF